LRLGVICAALFNVMRDILRAREIT
jgi:hypothetical protein